MIDVFCNNLPLKVNPPKMCQLTGVVLATLGINGAIPLIHGSQGCSNFVKHLMSKHFKEPMDIATTALNEKVIAAGGEKRLLNAIKNLRDRLDPELIVVMTTCLTETIGDNLGVVKDCVVVRTPSYSGTHVEGYDSAIKEIIKFLADDCIERKNSINVISGFVNPADVRELKKILTLMGVEHTILTDLTSLDMPILKKRRSDTTVEKIRESVNAIATFSFGKEGKSGGEYLEKFGVNNLNLRFPIGIINTDRFLLKVSEITGAEISDKVVEERNYALDGMVDVSHVLRGKKVAIFGDVDKVIALSEFAFEVGMKVKAVLIPVKCERFVNEMEYIAVKNNSKIAVFENSDLYTLHKFLRDNPVDVLIGDYRGRYIAEKEKIPLLRVGFPVCDRFGYHRKPIFCYAGALRMAEEMANLIVGKYYG